MRCSWRLLSLAFLVLTCTPEERSNVSGETTVGAASGEVDPSPAATAEDEFDPAGFWELAWMPGYDRTTLVLERLEGESWRARFYRATCTGNRWCEVSARREAGVIVLGNSDCRITDRAPQALLPAHIDGVECLVPDFFQGKLDSQAHLPPSGKETEGWAFVRVEATDPVDFHARWLATPWPTFDFGTAGEEEITLEDLEAEEEQ